MRLLFWPLMRQILLLTLIAMAYLLYKKRHRAKALLFSFLNFEFVLVVEVCTLHRLTITPHPSVATHLSLCSCASSFGTSQAYTYPPHPTGALHMLRSSVPLSQLSEPLLRIQTPSLRIRVTGTNIALFRTGSSPSMSTNTMRSPGSNS